MFYAALAATAARRGVHIEHAVSAHLLARHRVLEPPADGLLLAQQLVEERLPRAVLRARGYVEKRDGSLLAHASHRAVVGLEPIGSRSKVREFSGNIYPFMP